MNNLNTNILNPAWVTGFIDGEGTFFVSITKNNTIRLNFQVQLQFVITQHIRDTELMYKIKDFFGVGLIASDGPTKLQYRIRIFNDLEKSLFPLLDMYPLQTQKKLDRLAFREVYNLIKDKKHLTDVGLNNIRIIKSSINRARK